MDKRLKSPEELFKHRELQLLGELERQNKLKEDEEIKKELPKKLIKPKVFFGDEIIEKKIYFRF